MQVDWHDENGDSAVRSGVARFNASILKGFSCPIIEISGRQPGPRLCVMAGVHINEASSIDAALELPAYVDPDRLCGSISIIPVVSTHHLYKFTMVTAPSVGRDLHWSYPGRPDGCFNEALADALLSEWACDADVLLDLHGGDLDERMARYVIVQTTDSTEFNRRAMEIAACFDTDLVVALHPRELDGYGRCCTARAREGRLALVAEAGDQGVTDVESATWLRTGTLGVARTLGMLDGPGASARPQVYFDRYEWITAPSGGIVERDYRPGQWVVAGSRIGTVRDLYGREVDEICAPDGGCVMMQKTTQFAPKGYFIGAIAVPRNGVIGTGTDVSGRDDDRG